MVAMGAFRFRCRKTLKLIPLGKTAWFDNVGPFGSSPVSSAEGRSLGLALCLKGRHSFFPFFNDAEINTPNVCGSGPDNVPVKILRAMSAANLTGHPTYQ
jgi:hypothetical protein